MATHGQTSGGVLTPEYKAFRAAKRRCSDPNLVGYKNYGGRGIQFRFSTFQEFFAAIGARPKGTCIERINNDGHYEVGNVRWATRREQRANRRVAVFSAEGKRKLSAARVAKHRKNSAATILKMSVARMGINYSDATRQKMSDSQLAKKFHDITGRTFGRLTAMWPIGRHGQFRMVQWLCSCVCGRYVHRGINNLTRGTSTKSCGCCPATQKAA